MMTNKQRIIAIAGPTAVGKTALSIALAKALDGEIISCDSMQIYKGMDIATAKPTIEEMQGIPHHLIGFVEPDEPFSVYKYCEEANIKVPHIIMDVRGPLVYDANKNIIETILLYLPGSSMRKRWMKKFRKGKSVGFVLIWH